MPKRLTRDEFIKRANKIHNNQFDYSKVIYENNCTDIDIICPIHGIFKLSPKKHLQGRGCPKCDTEKHTMDFILKAKKVHNDKYDYSKTIYKGSRKQVCVICSEHGEFWQEAESHIRGKGCKKCGNFICHERQKYKQDDIIDLFKKIHNSEYDYNNVNYFNIKKKIKIICPIHGEFEQIAGNHLQGHGCQLCAKGISKNENEIYKFCRNLCNDTVQRDREILKPKELDIYIPSKKLGIEYNGLYWHSDEFKTDNFYHLNKTINCEKKGIELIQIFEDEWIKKQEIVCSIIRKEIGKVEKFIPLSDCIIEEMNENDSIYFLNENCIEGSIKSDFRYSLIFDNHIVSIMTFRCCGKSKYELLRFCDKTDTVVVGSCNYLLNYFIKKVRPTEIIVNVDRRWGNGKIYENIGFIHLYNTEPIRWYLNRGSREKLTVYRDDIKGIYDCGTKVLKKTIKYN